MVEKNGIYKCNVCGNVVEVIDAQKGDLFCCGEIMKLQKISIMDAAQEKHVPVVEKEENKVKVKVGSIEHPMDKDHYIELIEVLANDRVIASVHLKPEEKPEAEFCLSKTEGITVRAYCNLHGLWEA